MGGGTDRRTDGPLGIFLSCATCLLRTTHHVSTDPAARIHKHKSMQTQPCCGGGTADGHGMPLVKKLCTLGCWVGTHTHTHTHTSQGASKASAMSEDVSVSVIMHMRLHAVLIDEVWRFATVCSLIWDTQKFLWVAVLA